MLYSISMETKLKIGDKFRVVGWIMIKGLTEGVWRVTNVQIPESQFSPSIYTITKNRGKKRFRYYAEDIDLWVDGHVANLNRIERVISTRKETTINATA